MLQESAGHWNLGLKASMQDPNMQVDLDQEDFFVVDLNYVCLPSLPVRVRIIFS